jgi:hypothetical protein
MFYKYYINRACPVRDKKFIEQLDPILVFEQ